MDILTGKSNKSKGLISKIERFSLHDGPGVRTLVVTKGCPLRCLWCSSPHTQGSMPELLYISGSCQGCGRCIPACPQKAVSPAGDGRLVRTDRNACGGCGACVAACPNRAREITGQFYAPEELLQEVERDAAFYRRSGGGVTVGGGEAAWQPDFTGEFLRLCQSHHIHTAMETSAFAPWEKLAPLFQRLDLIYIDIKHMEDGRHRALTGAGNRLILENIRQAARVCEVILRLPVIPGQNDSPENVAETARFASSLGNNLLRMELLPYHPFGMHRYEELGRSYGLATTEPPSDEHMERLRERACTAGIAVEIGG
jgi:pyruvate formate lyase activating enzyme